MDNYYYLNCVEKFDDTSDYLAEIDKIMKEQPSTPETERSKQERIDKLKQDRLDRLEKKQKDNQDALKKKKEDADMAHEKTVNETTMKLQDAKDEYEKELVKAALLKSQQEYDNKLKEIEIEGERSKMQQQQNDEEVKMMEELSKARVKAIINNEDVLKITQKAMEDIRTMNAKYDKRAQEFANNLIEIKNQARLISLEKQKAIAKMNDEVESAKAAALTSMKKKFMDSMNSEPEPIVPEVKPKTNYIPIIIGIVSILLILIVIYLATRKKKTKVVQTVQYIVPSYQYK